MKEGIIVKIWKIQDGSIHYLFAESAESAEQLYITEWIGDYDGEAFDPAEISIEEANAMRVFDEDTNEWTTLGDLYRKDSSPGYICGTDH